MQEAIKDLDDSTLHTCSVLSPPAPTMFLDLSTFSSAFRIRCRIADHLSQWCTSSLGLHFT